MKISLTVSYLESKINIRRALAWETKSSCSEITSWPLQPENGILFIEHLNSTPYSALYSGNFKPARKPRLGFFYSHTSTPHRENRAAEQRYVITAFALQLNCRCRRCKHMLKFCMWQLGLRSVGANTRSVTKATRTTAKREHQVKVEV